MATLPDTRAASPRPPSTRAAWARSRVTVQRRHRDRPCARTNLCPARRRSVVDLAFRRRGRHRAGRQHPQPRVAAISAQDAVVRPAAGAVDRRADARRRQSCWTCRPPGSTAPSTARPAPRGDGGRLGHARRRRRAGASRTRPPSTCPAAPPCPPPARSPGTAAGSVTLLSNMTVRNTDGDAVSPVHVGAHLLANSLDGRRHADAGRRCNITIGAGAIPSGVADGAGGWLARAVEPVLPAGRVQRLPGSTR